MLKRLLELEIERDAEITERIDRYEWGRAFLSPAIHLVWDANWILIERVGMKATEVVQAADEAIGSAGMHHRTAITLDPEDGARLAPPLEGLGWSVERGVYMVWRQAPDREPGVEVAERHQSEIEGLRRRLMRPSLHPVGVESDETIEQLLEWDRRIGAADGDRWFVAPANGDPASACRLLVRDGIGQVEDVGTLEEARGRGLARAVTLAAARASEAEGNELTYLGALANDWPRLLYSKLGFEEVGYAYEFRRKPLRS
jgi:ribosomal protein S18 acetylase RimI-like enzyme